MKNKQIYDKISMKDNEEIKDPVEFAPLSGIDKEKIKKEWLKGLIQDKDK